MVIGSDGGFGRSAVFDGRKHTHPHSMELSEKTTHMCNRSTYKYRGILECNISEYLLE